MVQLKIKAKTSNEKFNAEDLKLKFQSQDTKLNMEQLRGHLKEIR